MRRTATAALAAILALVPTSPLGCGEGEPGAAPAAAGSAGAAAEAPPERPGSPNAAYGLVEELLADREAVRHPADGGGRAWLEEDPGELVAGGQGRFAIAYEAGPHGVAEGGALFLQVSPFWGWSTPQTVEREAPGFTEVETDADGVRLEAQTVDRQLLAIAVHDAPLPPGALVRIRYGAGPMGATVDRFAERGTRLWIGVDGDGDGVRGLVPVSPAVRVRPGPPARLVLWLPSVARPGERVELVVAVLDAAGNAVDAAAGELVLEVPEGVVAPARLVLAPEGGGVARAPLTLGEAGVVRVSARGEGLEAESNPLVVSAGLPRVRWADLHGHSNLSDGTGTPEDWYRYARDVAALDVAALTDHDHWGIPFLDDTPEHWAAIEEATRGFHTPGRFVTLLGYEWTSWLYGHRHVLHFERDEAAIHSSIDPATDSPPELWDALRGQGALTFAHHSAGEPVATDWSIPPDPELEPVTEVASVHGSSEAPDAPRPVAGGIPGNWVRDVLGRGYRLGFVGSGDGHDGHPGLAHLAAPSAGLAAVFSEELTRAGVLEALRARRSYATNGPRIVLHTSLGGAPMGAAVPAAAARRVEVRVVATAPLEAVELVSAEGVVERVPGEGLRVLGFESELGDVAPGAVLYVRVLQQDGGAAWSSPYFFE